MRTDLSVQYALVIDQYRILPSFCKYVRSSGTGSLCIGPLWAFMYRAFPGSGRWPALLFVSLDTAPL